MSLLSRHLEQIQLSSEAIATLPFPPPKIFTNALLSTHDITSLIRDTEPHERALFSVPPPPPPISQPDPATSLLSSTNSTTRRQTVFNVTQGEVTTGSLTGSRAAPRRNTAVAAVLGADLHNQVRRSEGKGDVDVDVLLRGVEKLNAVYEVKGTAERVRGLRERLERVEEGLRFYEAKVQRQTADLERMNRGERWDGDGEDYGRGGEVEVTDEDLRAEEEEIRELELKKKALEERVRGMERDLGGLLR